MATNDQKRPEATHRQRADLHHASLPIGDDGQPMAIISCSASDLVPTVQYGNIMLECTITRAVSDDGIEDLVAKGREIAKGAQTVVGAERRILQWAINPSLRVTQPDGQPTEDAPHLPPPPTPPPAPQAGTPIVPTEKQDDSFTRPPSSV